MPKSRPCAAKRHAGLGRGAHALAAAQAARHKGARSHMPVAAKAAGPRCISKERAGNRECPKPAEPRACSEAHPVALSRQEHHFYTA